ncbi:dystrophin, isoforms A/C/F/G/H-like [Phlebotomus papatasi]|uniref:dystrophin, isoforms A/C/F/G/H-like n=1 Tax=Phlebotomus papatasi TaxID=29031 RepID=UPI0024842187|nr:dystrophin, isoforms A/C/F/G/H-like [Phlebotomus papatasi]
MAQAITDEVHVVVERWNQLQHQAEQRGQMLEQAVSEAQTSEGRVSNLQIWIYKVDEILTEHIENDITMEDLPHDFQVRYLGIFYVTNFCPGQKNHFTGNAGLYTNNCMILCGNILGMISRSSNRFENFSEEERLS